MIAKNTVYLNADKSKAVPEGDKEAKFLLVRAGAEIAESKFSNIEGAEELISAEAKKETTHAPHAHEHATKGKK